MGIIDPTPIQSEVIPAMLAGRDIVGQARTGSGKTLAFAIPIVSRCDPAVRGVQALILVPTRELAIQVAGVIAPLAQGRRLRTTLLYGGRGLGSETNALAGGAQIVVGTPGRTLDHLRQGHLRLNSLRIFVLDEADEMLDKGFGPDVDRILAQTPREKQMALLSATMPDWVTRTAKRHLRNPLDLHVDSGLQAPPEIEHVVYEMESQAKMNALRELLDGQGPDPIIVFGRTKHGVKKLARQLVEFGYDVAALQGNLSQNAREKVMADFRSGNVRVLIATNVAARGLDIADVEQIINYELPESAELFTHRAGRTGRMGKAGEAVTFITPEDATKWRQIERALGRQLTRVPWRKEPANATKTQDLLPKAPTASGNQRRFFRRSYGGYRGETAGRDLRAGAAPRPAGAGARGV